MLFSEGQTVAVYKDGQKQDLTGTVVQVTDKNVFVAPDLPAGIPDFIKELMGEPTPIPHNLDGSARDDENAGWSIKPLSE